MTAAPKTKLMPQPERWAVLAKLANHEHQLDVLNRSAVDAYIRSTGASFLPTMIGAHKCALMGKDLSAMKNAGLLTRYAAGIEGLSGMGFPRWVWSYRLTDAGRALVEPEAAP